MNTLAPAPFKSFELLSPQHWHTWLGLGVLRILQLLPTPLQRVCGRAIGRAYGSLPSKWSRVARVNIDLCFPEMSEPDRANLLKRHFESLGIGVCETANAYWATDAYVDRVTEVIGREHVQAALKKGRGVLIVGAHFTTIEFATRILRMLGPTNVLFRPTKNPVLARFLLHHTAKLASRAIPHTAIREVISALRANEAVWYAPDQSFRNKGAALVPFFGIPAASATLTARLARISGAAVVTYFPERLADGTYRVTINPMTTDARDADPIADVARYHALIEAHVRRVPEQYLWIHRRFKGLCDSYPDYYGRDSRRAPINPNPPA
jgi:Kdo2-lipid IVA lauroyltransferase/acyltransferase